MSEPTVEKRPFGNFESAEDALGSVRGVAEDIEQLWDRICRRLGSGDVPPDLADEMIPEFEDDVKTMVAELKEAEQVLALALPKEADDE